MNAAEAQLMLSRSEIRAETRFSTCPGGGRWQRAEKFCFRDRNQTINHTLSRGAWPLLLEGDS